MRPDAHTLVAAYAVDALDEQERADVRDHLEECETCQEDLRSFRETVAVMAAASAEAPPARMRDAVLARARATAQLPPITAFPAGTSPTAAPTGTPPAAPTHPRGTAGSPARGALHRTRAEARIPRSRPVSEDGAGSTSARPSRMLFGLAASVLTVGALGAGAYGVVQSDRLDDARQQQAAVQRVLSADDVVSLSAVPQLTDGVQGDDEVVVLASASQDAALLLPSGLPVAPEGSTWQAWTLTGDRAVSAGTFDVAAGEAVSLQASVAGADAVAVSLEPEGGSESPSTDPVLVLPLA